VPIHTENPDSFGLDAHPQPDGLWWEIRPS
jgi:hypothetical protein